MGNILDPADPQALLRRIIGLERRLRILSVALTGAQYAHDEGGIRDASTVNSFATFTGSPVITLAVPESGKVRVAWGFTGFNRQTATAFVQLSPVMSGANTLAGRGNCSAIVSGDNIGAGTDPQSAARSASRTKLFEGLTPGSTTFTLHAFVPTGTTTANHSIQHSWLLVEPMP